MVKFRISKKAQISIEYIIIVAFVSFVLIAVLGIAFFYSGVIKDRLKIIQMTNFANKIISTAESVFYYGEPSKATIFVFIPENIQNIEIIEDSLIVSIQLNSGISKLAFFSKIPITGNINNSWGIKKIEVTANSNNVNISSI